MSKRKKARKKSSIKHIKQKASRLFISVGIIGTIALLGYGVWTARHILEPISTFASEGSSNRVENESDQIKFYSLTLNEHEYVTSAGLTIIDTHEKSIKTIALPANTLMHLPYGLSEFKLASLYKIAEFEGSSDLRNLVTQSLIEYYGVPSQNLFIVKDVTAENTTIPEWLMKPSTLGHLAFDSQWISKNIITTKSPWDMLKLANTMRNVPSEFISEIDIVKEGIAKQEEMKDATTVAITDQNKLDAYIKKSFQNINIMQEKASIQIKNGADVAGLATKFSRIVTNMGGVVVSVDNNEKIIDNTEIIVKNNQWENSTTLQELKSALNTKEVHVSVDNNSTVDITVIVGKNYAITTQGQK